MSVYNFSRENKETEFFLARLCGSSMFPTLRGADKVVVKSVGFEELKLRDIIIFKQNGLKVCHRIIKIDRKNSRLYTRGDFNAKGDEEVKAEDIYGRVAAVLSGSKFYPLKFQKTLIYYKTVNLTARLKDTVIFLLDNFYRFAFLRKLLKQLSAARIECRCVYDETDNAFFDGFYNLLPQNYPSYSIFERILGFYDGRPIAKLWILKKGGKYWFWGPYVKLFYRARGIGRSLVQEAQDVILKKETARAASIYALVPSQVSIIKFYENSGFLKEGALDKLPYFVFKKTD